MHCPKIHLLQIVNMAMCERALKIRGNPVSHRNLHENPLQFQVKFLFFFRFVTDSLPCLLFVLFQTLPSLTNKQKKSGDPQIENCLLAFPFRQVVDYVIRSIYLVTSGVQFS